MCLEELWRLLGSGFLGRDSGSCLVMGDGLLRCEVRRSCGGCGVVYVCDGGMVEVVVMGDGILRCVRTRSCGGCGVVSWEGGK